MEDKKKELIHKREELVRKLDGQERRLVNLETAILQTQEGINKARQMRKNRGGVNAPQVCCKISFLPWILAIGDPFFFQGGLISEFYKNIF